MTRALLALLAGSWMLALAAPTAAATICDVDEPAGWNVIPEASSLAAGAQFLCNYRIDRPAGSSGSAITIEYFCAPEDASSRYDSVVGDRDTVTTPSGAPPGLLIIEEGKQARNPDNPQDTGVFSSFFPGTEFGLFEKEWRLLNEQVFATIVVLTNERGKLSEELRFGVDDAEAIARVLANRHRSAAGCPVPEIPLVAGSTGGAGVPLIPILVGAGGVSILIGGTRLIWRRKSTKPLPPSNIGDVPDACAGAKASYEGSRERVLTLREAAQDLADQLRRAETIHANNIIKANMAVGFEIGSVIGGTVGDLAQAVGRPRGSAPRQQIDDWKPPSKLGAKMAKALEVANEAIDAARARVTMILEEMAALRAKIDEMVANTDLVRNAKQMHEFWSNKLETALADLPKAVAARKQYADLDALAKKQSQLITKGTAIRAPLERALIALPNEIEGAELFAKRMIDPVKDEIAQIERRIKRAEGTIGPGGRRSPLSPDRARTLEQLQEAQAELHEKLSGLERKHGQEIADLKSKLETSRKQLKELDDQPGWKELLADRDRTSASLQDTARTLHQLEDVTEADVARLRTQVSQAAADLVDATGLTKAQALAGVDDKARVLERAQFDLALAEDALHNLRRHVEIEGGVTTARIPAGAEQGWSIGRVVRWPLRVFGELVFGVGQSPEEIMAILRKGFENIELLRTGYTAIAAEADAEHARAAKLRQALDDCIKGKVPAPSPAAASPGAPVVPPAPASPSAPGPASAGGAP